MKGNKYIKNLDYSYSQPKQVPIVQIFAIILAIAIIATFVKMCFDNPKPATVQELNTDRK